MKTASFPLLPAAFSRTILVAILLTLPGIVRAAAAPAVKEETRAAKATTVKPHVLAPTERINVSVEGEQDLQKLVTLDDKGEVDLMLIRKIKLSGLTVDQAARAIEKAYVDGLFLRRPKVSITVENQVVQTVTVLGQVKQSGKIVIPSDQDVDIVDVIIAAQGFNELARESSVKVTRILEDGTAKTWDDIDVGAILKGKKDRKDALVILPGDIINVPMRIF